MAISVFVRVRVINQLVTVAISVFVKVRVVNQLVTVTISVFYESPCCSIMCYLFNHWC